MEQVQDLKIKGVSVVDEHQPEKMDVTSTVNDNQPEKMVVASTVNDDSQLDPNEAEIAQDEEELPDANSCSDEDDDDDDDDDEDEDDDDDCTNIVDYELLNETDALPNHVEGSYKIVHINEIRQYQDEDISVVINSLSVSRAVATVLLLHNWNVQAVISAWTKDAYAVREEVGLPEFLYNGPPDSSDTDDEFGQMTCRNCSGDAAEYLGYDSFCSHKFCYKCWQVLIQKSLIEERLIVRCPVENCNAILNPDLVRLLALQGNPTYSSLFARSYLADNTKGKWCPTSGCNHAVILEPGTTISDFKCKCLFSICYECLQESHQPVSCALAECWTLETINQSHNWEVVFLRNCPRCDRPLQVTDQYKHMECPSCNYHFCNTCLCSWHENGHWAADYFTHICTEVKLIEVAELSENRATASKELNRYQDTLERWQDIDKDQRQTLAKLVTMQLGELKLLAEKQGLQLSDTSFVTDVWLQIAECKRVFKWASVYDYYVLANKDKNRRSLFDDLSRKGAYVMDRLRIVASELRKFIATDAPAAEFEDFRERLCFKSSVTQNYFENMVIAIRRGFTDMEALRTMLASREAVEDVGTSSGMTGSADATSRRICPHCIFSNDSSTPICVMCYH